MREILFKGKRVDNGEWVEGYVSEHTICGDETYIATVIEKKPENIYDFESYIVIPETVGQYTGLTDKNGVKIFEGDIINYRDMYFTIEWQENNGRFLGIEENRIRPDKEHYICYVTDELKNSQVVGNIMED